MPPHSLKLGDISIVTASRSMSDREWIDLAEQCEGHLSHQWLRGLVVDVTRVEEIDSFAARLIADLACFAQLLGTPVAVVGIQPAVACAMVYLGVELGRAHTALDVERGIAIIREHIASRQPKRVHRQ